MTTLTAPEVRGDRTGTNSERRQAAGRRTRTSAGEAPARPRRRSKPALPFLLGLVQAAAIALAASAATPGHATETSLKPWADGPRTPFSLDLVAGGRVDLAALRGRVVLVHFFATWCEPCRAEMASLQRLAEHYAERPVAIVAVNVAEVAPRVARFFEAQPVSFPVLLDSDRTVTRAWKVEGLPTTIVLDPALTPVLVAAGDLDWDRADIRRVLEGRLPSSSTN